ncbi:MAG: tryptophan 7-halogenase [Proteobacteria bacterium]|nr:tryptophan 7-halogenase [Pseudomonadota bacterium]
MTRLDLDVAILGGGMAGNLLARQLRRQSPGLQVGLFERSRETGYRVGESLTEIASNYLVRRLGLSTYLYDRHLPKNGLRFLFDDAGCETPLADMSEIGSVALPYHPGFQIDRSRLDADLLAMNAADGVRVATGAKADQIELGDAAPHAFRVRDDDGERRVFCRWLVDATGRASLLAKSRSLREPEPVHDIAAVWGRFEGVSDLDELGGPEFRERVRHTSRRLSTVHFCYRGAWVWVIPLHDGITSVGVVAERRTYERELGTPDAFGAFLLRPRALGSLFEAAKPVDQASLQRIPYATRKFFDSGRWGLSGESGAFADPLYSPGGDYIALQNDLLCDLIARDAAGEDIAARSQAYDAFMHLRHEAAMRLYRGLYDCLGSYELFGLKYHFDLANYYNLWTTAFMCDRHLDLRWVRRQLRQRDAILGALDRFSTLFRELERELTSRGHYARGNRGEFSNGLERIDFLTEVGQPASDEEVLARTLAIFNDVRRRAGGLLGRSLDRDLPLGSFLDGTELLAASEGGGDR